MVKNWDFGANYWGGWGSNIGGMYPPPSPRDLQPWLRPNLIRRQVSKFGILSVVNQTVIVLGIVIFKGPATISYIIKPKCVCLCECVYIYVCMCVMFRVWSCLCRLLRFNAYNIYNVHVFQSIKK